MTVLWIAIYLLREAMARKWFLGLGILITAGLFGIIGGFQLEVGDGALATSLLFGQVLNNNIQATEMALRPVLIAISYATFYGSIIFGINACADFAPKLLAPGRIEHLISQPVQRWELLIGTYLGVISMIGLCVVYGAGGFTIILGLKTQVWSVGLLLAGGLAVVTFAAIYALMLVLSIAFSSTSVSALGGWVLLLLGVVASHRATILQGFESETAAFIFRNTTVALPRIATMGKQAAALAASQPIPWQAALQINGGTLLFGLGTLLFGVWLFERKDY